MSDKRQLSDSEEESNGQATNRIENDGQEHEAGEQNASRPGDKKKAKRKKLEFEDIYLSQLPSSECYEKSYMHKENITHVLSATKTDFIITGSIDGAIKFWKKQPLGIEFVKHYKAHRDKLIDIACDCSDKQLASTSLDKTIKVFDVINFDMINMIKLKFVASKCIWIYSYGDPIQAIAVTDSETPRIFIYDSVGKSAPLKVLDSLHMTPVSALKYNPVYSTVVSIDSQGFVEHWSSPKYEYAFPDKNRIGFESKFETDLFEFVKNKLVVHDICFSANGQLCATMSNDRKVRIFKHLTGKLIRVYDESLTHCSNQQQTKQIVPNMEFGRRMAIERDLDKMDQLKNERLAFDQSGYFLFYPTMFGVKMVNWYTNKCLKIIGKSENIRPLSIALYQNTSTSQVKGTITLEMAVASNPNLENSICDPSLFTNAYKRNRFYIFTKRDPEELETEDGESNIVERDVVNEKTASKDLLSTAELTGGARKLYSECVVHTSMGDIHCNLFGNLCPKTVENFCVHSKNGYYNGHIFHRVIKSFMVQTGDPTGTGTGGESIWGKNFEDEFHPTLKHDIPYTLSMANAGPNTNGSQFFITVSPCQWLDQKHTVFGRVVKGMEVVENISKVKTNSKTDKPYDDVKIINISLKS